MTACVLHTVAKRKAVTVGNSATLLQGCISLPSASLVLISAIQAAIMLATISRRTPSAWRMGCAK